VSLPIDFPVGYDCMLARRQSTAGDLILAVAAVMWSLLWFMHFMGNVSSETLRLQVYQGSRLVIDEPLTLSEKRVETISNEKFTMHIEISSDGVRILPMSKDECPNGICSKLGTIRRPGEALFCVPNEVSVSITGGGSADGFDAVAR
jgi:hypothetical protein